MSTLFALSCVQNKSSPQLLLRADQGLISLAPLNRPITGLEIISDTHTQRQRINTLSGAALCKKGDFAVSSNCYPGLIVSKVALTKYLAALSTRNKTFLDISISSVLLCKPYHAPHSILANLRYMSFILLHKHDIYVIHITSQT